MEEKISENGKNCCPWACVKKCPMCPAGGGSCVVSIALSIFLIVASISVWSYANSYSKQIDPSSIRSFTVSGEGKVVTVPDVATFSFSVITEGGKDLSALQTENVKKVNEAITFVKGNDVDEKDIKTEQYSVEPRYQYYDCSRTIYSSADEEKACPPPEIVGYTIRQSVLVKVRDFEVAGDLISGVVEKGANSVSRLQFTIDDPLEAMAKAREMAIQRAEEKAEQIADAAGFSVGKLISINEGGYTPQVYRNAKVSYDEVLGMGGAAPSAAIEAGSEEVIVNVTLQYEIR